MEALRWIDAVLAGLVVLLLTLETVRRWHEMPVRLRRSMPWVVGTYVVIAYGCGEAAGQHASLGLRSFFLLLDLTGLLAVLVINVVKNEGYTTDR